MRARHREGLDSVPKEESVKRVAELFGHAMSHCQLQDDPYQRDRLLSDVMEAYRELG